MQRVSGANALPNGAGAGKATYQDYNPATGQPGTTPNAAALTALQEELASFIESQGLALNPADNTQLHQAIGSYISNQITSTLAGLTSGLGSAQTPQQVAAAIAQALIGYAPLLSPIFTGTPTAPTQSSTDNSTRLATTAFVQGLFASSQAPNGYCLLPGGLIMQWASVGVYFNGRGPGSISWPIAFPNNCLFAISGGNGTNSGGGGIVASVTSKSNYGATVMMDGFDFPGVNSGASLIAIGN